LPALIFFRFLSSLVFFRFSANFLWHWFDFSLWEVKCERTIEQSDSEYRFHKYPKLEWTNPFLLADNFQTCNFLVEDRHD
jgi:hypothetical protein